MEKIVKSDGEWREQLTSDQFRVTRRKGTERAFSSAYHALKTDGVYRCICCDLDVFDSVDKFDSRTGWPSYTRAASPEALTEAEDRSFFSIRTEVLCARCDAHLGHVFPDGPPPTGARYCINSVALRFQPREKKN